MTTTAVSNSDTSSPPFYQLSQDTIQQIFSLLPLRQIVISKSVSKFFNQTLSSPSYLSLLPSLPFLALRSSPSHRHSLSNLPTLHAFDPNLNQWLRFPFNFLPFSAHQPVASSLGLIYLWADTNESGSPWRAQWKLFTITIESLQCRRQWTCLEKLEWGDVFDILKRPRLVKGNGNRILMIGGLKSSFLLNSSCTTILILRLDLETLEWNEAGRMPIEMFTCFQESSKFKVFGGGDRVCFSAKRIGKLALWDNSKGKADWKWIESVPWNGDGVCRGFLFEAGFTASP
ncbi:SKP1-interacting partner 15 [Heracleum sosnowskyi]|uniref:SKP1-interacting partner 15 n=1 Tax=Heracleum sosnowskyi TaxID=360622 RepID=A0AAD8MW63_9APIA|nr:SKP1-interacting partner 15 [Heracleum sosnowskyi]